MSEPTVEALSPAGPNIAGDPGRLDAPGRALLERAAGIGRTRFAPRAARVDREASFPADNFADLREGGWLALAVPVADGGLGADFATAALVCAEFGRHCGSTALAFTMHLATSLWIGEVADRLPLPADERAAHARRRARQFERIAGKGLVYAQAFSESGAAGSGSAPWATLARPVEGGYRVDGEKVFTSLAGHADVYAVSCTRLAANGPGTTGIDDGLMLAIPADSRGIEVAGEWDALGMRGTASRRVRFRDVFVADEERLLPEGWVAAAARRQPHLFILLAAPYLGIAQAAFDFTVHYLRGESPGMAPVKRRMYPTKQIAVAEMRMRLEQARALYLQCLSGASLPPDRDARLRLYAAHATVMESANALCASALRTCGGQSMLKSLPLERLYRDSRCGALMLPWTAELCLDRLGRESLYDDGEGSEAIE